MQLGTRWNVGAEPPAGLSEALHMAIASVEEDLAGIDVTGWRWTLTWLEGRPVVELDDGTIIRSTAEGIVSVHDPVD